METVTLGGEDDVEDGGDGDDDDVRCGFVPQFGNSFTITGEFGYSLTISIVYWNAHVFRSCLVRVMDHPR
ncbi:hypothetical protein ISN45_Aa01g029630 [Arabidopsis thaliana x Arabidopsis arenosa]|uniref:Uncharacterized protein n=1 Tax=Arabidopsis thaliana x Arabidopsis arenosa TaxID=1240361 RepID=A0A8T2C7F5_9BRAS|nr:hypothetical protein ISN45_Aa01g029630 [Arabidopsis thaliana x Arabidopsis arenosa]